jgi:hypothetical protein
MASNIKASFGLYPVSLKICVSDRLAALRSVGFFSEQFTFMVMTLSVLEKYFESATIPDYPIRINNYMTLHEGFLESQLLMAKAGNKRAIDRLVMFHDYLEGLTNPPA